MAYKDLPSNGEAARSADGPGASKARPVTRHGRATVVPDVIREIKQLPMGQYSPLATYGLEPDWQHSADFVVFLTGSSSCILLVAVEAFGQLAQFEVARRLSEKNVVQVTFRRAAREILRSVHDAHAAVKLEEDTDTEAAAWDLIDGAVDSGASDIHLETRGSFAQFYLRIHGERIPQPEKATKTVADICSVLYNVHADSMVKGPAWNPVIPQDTTIERITKSSGKRVQLRFHSGPIHPAGNFQMVTRLLVMDEESIRPMSEMGLTPAQVSELESMLLGSQGIVLAVGPVNSGKSTTLQTALARIYEMRGRNIKVVTVEDPVEYLVRNACQQGVPAGRKDMVDETTGSIYTTLLKAMLRQDPDVAMVGEIRDHDSAEAAKQLGLAGRKLLSTLHVYEAYAVFARLRELGIPESVLYMNGFISGVVCQRLLPVLCEGCRIPLDEALASGRIPQDRYERVRQVTGGDCKKVHVRGDGCPECRGIGITGRTLAAELLVPDATFLALMSRGDTLGAREHWGKRSAHLDIGGLGSTLLAHAVSKMKAGLVDPSHIEMHIGRLELRRG